MKVLIAFIAFLTILGCKSEPKKQVGVKKQSEIRKMGVMPKYTPGALLLDTISPLHMELSKKFNFQSHVKHFTTADGRDSAHIELNIYDKKMILIQRIDIGSQYLCWDDTYFSNNVRSYVTGKNADLQLIDDDYGDIVVADFNFDGLDDFAMKEDLGGNAGPLYRFYIQSVSGQFKLSEFLTTEVQFFPYAFDKRTKSFETRVRANVEGVRLRRFVYNVRSKKWKETHSEFVYY